jgi:hypothetical protein
VSARIHDLLFLPNARCCNPFQKLVSIYLILCKLTKQHSQTLDPIPGHHVEQALSSVNQDVTQPNVNESFREKSEFNVPTDSQHANRIQSTNRDLDEFSSKGKENAVPQDQTEDAALTPTSTRRAIEELLLLRTRELRENGVRGNLHSSPHYGAGSFAQPHTNPTPDASHCTQPLRPEYKIPSASVTNVYNYNYYIDPLSLSWTPSPLPPIRVINKNFFIVNNKNSTNGSNSSESGADEGEY